MNILRPTSVCRQRRLPNVTSFTPRSGHSTLVAVPRCRSIRIANHARPRPLTLRLCRTATTVPLSGASQGSSTSIEQALPALLSQVDELAQDILAEPSSERPIPTEDTILHTLRFYERLVKRLSHDSEIPKSDESNHDTTATSALLGAVDRHHTQRPVTKSHLLSTISRQAITIVEHPTVFISPAVLKVYISLQATLGKPHSFPHVLNLYRTKPLPRPISASPYVSYRSQRPNSPSTAVDSDVANTALASVIRLHNLPLSLAVVDETYCTRSFARAKLIRMALLPATGAALLPVAAYALANKFALLQNTMDEGTATNVAMTGILTYAAAVGTMGYVALTTSNDQMVRVTWATGLPLWERWIREEERAAVEKIAQAWGFKKRERWGEEEGVDWDELREWTGVRGMVLDRVSLMDGME